MKAVAGNSTKFIYAKGSNLDDDAVLEEKSTMFGKTLHRDNRTKEELLQEALKIANQADLIVAALRESAQIIGECSAAQKLEILQTKKQLLQALLKLNKLVVLILFNGRPLGLNHEVETVPAILKVWFADSEAGFVIADVLFRDENPSGKLTTTFSRSVGQLPIYYGQKNTGRPFGK